MKYFLTFGEQRKLVAKAKNGIFIFQTQSSAWLALLCLFSLPRTALAGEGNFGGTGNGLEVVGPATGGTNVSCGTPGGGLNVNPPGLNSCAAALSGLPNDGALECMNDDEVE